MWTFPPPCSLDHAQDVDATLTWGVVGWGCERSFGHVPSSTLHKILMLRSQGVGWGEVGMLTFLRPRSLDLAQDFDATLTWGGVGMLTFLRPRSLDLAQDVDATLTRGVVRWGANVPSTTFSRPFTRCWCYARMGWGGPTLHTTLMLHKWGGVEWGNDNAHSTLRKTLMLRPRWSNYHGLR